MMPLPSSVWPSGTAESGGAWIVPIKIPALFELGKPSLDRGCVKLRRLDCGGLKRSAVEIGRDPRLSEVIEAHREVVEDIGVRGLKTKGFEERRLRLTPTRLRGIEVAQGQTQRLALRMIGHVAAQLPF